MLRRHHNDREHMDRGHKDRDRQEIRRNTQANTPSKYPKQKHSLLQYKRYPMLKTGD